MKRHPITLALHGGAGAFSRRSLGPQREAAHRAALQKALAAGYALLARGGSAVDAVVAAVEVLEDSPLFNAGRGAVYTHEGGHELDAAVMDGATRRAGAVAAVRTVKNPVHAALLVMRCSPYVMLCGRGAERFAARHGARLVAPSYFHTRERYAELVQARARARRTLDDSRSGAARSGHGDAVAFGTVGAVALDRHGNLAAATSTGGLTNKRWGRIGDSPVIGAGTYADNASVAVSTTGAGEAFIRAVAAHDIAALVRYRGYSVRRAALEVITRRIPAAGGRGGAIVLDRHGDLAMVFNTRSMFRGVVRADGQPRIAIFR
jgi:beta-aspartyl-peptidase (threonine type)